MHNLQNVVKYLQSVKDRNKLDIDGYEQAKAILSSEKKHALLKENQAEAKHIWCLEQILKIQHRFAEAFTDLKSGHYYEAWCKLERVEIKVNNLERHFNLDDDEFYILSIVTFTEQFQSLFPYKFFVSPGFIYRKKTCSVCNETISVRNPCEHVKGEIYNGEMCHHIIEEFEPLEISIVPNPVQKYSVLWLTNSDGNQTDHYDYSNVAYVAAGLRKPFDGWELHHTHVREKHELYKDIGRNDKCPCGSDKKYKRCCLKEEGVLRPHINLVFENPPPLDLPNRKYSREKFPRTVRKIPYPQNQN